MNIPRLLRLLLICRDSSCGRGVPGRDRVLGYHYFVLYRMNGQMKDCASERLSWVIWQHLIHRPLTHFVAQERGNMKIYSKGC